MILSKFPENCMKSRKCLAVGRVRAEGAPLDPPLVIHGLVQPLCMDHFQQ